MANLTHSPISDTAGKASVNTLGILVVIVVLALIAYFFSSGANMGEVVDIANAEIKAIHDGDTAAAYKMTTTGFQKGTSLEAFTTFIGQYPILQQYSTFKITDQKVDKTAAAVAATLVGADGRQMRLELQLVMENNEWRIQGVRVLPLTNAVPEMASDNSGATIKAIVVSDDADADGYVTQAKPTIDKLAAKIFVTVQVEAPQAGGKIEASITQLSNGVKLGPSKADMTKKGNILKAFSFTRVTSAWATGEYEVAVKLSSGDAKALKFSIK